MGAGRCMSWFTIGFGDACGSGQARGRSGPQGLSEGLSPTVELKVGLESVIIEVLDIIILNLLVLLFEPLTDYLEHVFRRDITSQVQQ
jgi:hypothetical protein